MARKLAQKEAELDMLQVANEALQAQAKVRDPARAHPPEATRLDPSRAAAPARPSAASVPATASGPPQGVG